MNRAEIIQLRLFNQGLSEPFFDKPDEVIAHFGAMQAQDYSMALWAVGLRMKNANRTFVGSQIDSGSIIRTHILRPTWHLVHQKDIQWMMELSAPNVKKATQYIDKKEGLTDDFFLKAWKIIEQQFKEADNLSKEDMMFCLLKNHIVVSNLLATQIIIRAELEMFLCNGYKKGTYTLFEKRVPPSNKISKTEAIIKLTQIYFQSRGPATIKDFIWWSGLSTTDAKIGMAELSKKLNSFIHNELKYYYFEPKNSIAERSVFALLPCYDEYTVSYSESRCIVLPNNADSSETGNGIFKPILLSENEIIGTWRKSKKSPFVEIQTFSENIEIPAKNIKESIESFNISK
ncbi:winged helix DNA-binding domain-containing protein [Emticicia sp. SJ17W-69]|uniref:winged helix DNA-binding domain-containing protein n=1 Tax=Emticicia sp. SJ17W-69 TaxID=3421657 RepID=UPI003EBE1391